MDLLLVTTLRGLMRKNIWMKFQHVLSAEVFQNSNAATIFLLIESLHSTSKRDLTGSLLRTAMLAEIRTPDRRQELTDLINAMMEVRRGDVRRSEQAIRRFLARGYAEQALFYYTTHCNDVALDYSVPAGLLERAAAIVQVGDEPTVASRRVGLPGDNDMARHTVGLGYSDQLDHSLLGGLGNGELGVVLAPPARGKTSYLLAAATYAVQTGRHVLYFTLEIAKRKVFLRYFQTLVHMTMTDMQRFKELVAIKREQVPGELYVADYSSNRLTPSLVHAEIQMLRSQGIPISYVVVDYAELMDPTGGFGRLGANSRTLGDMVKDLRRVAAAFDIPVLTAWQVNRGGHDKHVFGESDISECWEVVKHADIILGLNQGPVELANNVMRIKVLKQRESPARPLVYLHSDMTRNIIKPLEDTEVDGVEYAARSYGQQMEPGGGPRVQVYGPSTDGGPEAGSSGSSTGRRCPPADPASSQEDGGVVPEHDSGVDQREGDPGTERDHRDAVPEGRDRQGEARGGHADHPDADDRGLRGSPIPA